MKNDKRLTVATPLIGLSDEIEAQYIEGCVQMGADSVLLEAPCDNIVRSKRAIKYQHLSDKIMQPVPDQRVCDLPSIELAEHWAEVYRDLAPRYREKGIEPYIWVCHTIGHGGSLSTTEKAPFQTLVGMNGHAADGCFCPLDKNFVEYQCAFLSKIAEADTPLILLDDDFRLNLHGSMDLACFCPEHIAYYNSRFGTNFTKEELIERIAANDQETRTNFQAMNSDVLLEFAGALEKAVHAVNPNTRLGLASCMIHYSSEAADIRALARRLAGNTRPYVRVYGAPYHLKNNLRDLGRTIEMARIFHDHLNDGEIEISAEGDTHPHSRFYSDKTVTKTYLLATRCSGVENMLFYPYPFSASYKAEPVYGEAIQELSPIMAELDNILTPEIEAEGLAPVITLQNTTAIPLTKDMSTKERCWPDEPTALNPMTQFGIPLAKTADPNCGSGPVLLSGWHGCTLSDEALTKLLDRGAIVDAQAAQWLMARGHDIGLTNLTPLSWRPNFELYDGPLSHTYRNEQIWQLCEGEPKFYRMELKEEAIPCSQLINGENGERSVGSAMYEKNGRRIFLLPFDFYSVRTSKQTVNNLARMEQIRNAAQWMGLPVYVKNQEYLYLISYKKGSTKTHCLIKTGLDSKPTAELFISQKPVSQLTFWDLNGKIAGAVPYTVTQTEGGWLLEISKELRSGEFLMVQYDI